MHEILKDQQMVDTFSGCHIIILCYCFLAGGSGRYFWRMFLGQLSSLASNSFDPRSRHKNLYDWSFIVEEIDQFLSHSWHGNHRWKSLDAHSCQKRIARMHSGHAGSPVFVPDGVFPPRSWNAKVCCLWWRCFRIHLSMVSHNWNAGGKCNLDPSQAATHRLFGHRMHWPDICCYKGRRGFEYGCIPAKLEIYAGIVGQQLRAEVGGLFFSGFCVFLFVFFLVFLASIGFLVSVGFLASVCFWLLLALASIGFLASIAFLGILASSDFLVFVGFCWLFGFCWFWLLLVFWLCWPFKISKCDKELYRTSGFGLALA